jgi:hypothetical protein
MRNDLIIGLDIGSSFVKAVAGRQNEQGQLEIVATGKQLRQVSFYMVKLSILIKLRRPFQKRLIKSRFPYPVNPKSIISPRIYLGATFPLAPIPSRSSVKIRLIPYRLKKS